MNMPQHLTQVRVGCRLCCFIAEDLRLLTIVCSIMDTARQRLHPYSHDPRVSITAPLTSQRLPRMARTPLLTTRTSRSRRTRPLQRRSTSRT
jgi:hypothetical protein